MHQQIQILPLKDGKQTIYSGITLAGKYIPDPPDSRTYELPAGVYDLVPSKINSGVSE